MTILNRLFNKFRLNELSSDRQIHLGNWKTEYEMYQNARPVFGWKNTFKLCGIILDQINEAIFFFQKACEKQSNELFFVVLCNELLISQTDFDLL